MTGGGEGRGGEGRGGGRLFRGGYLKERERLFEEIRCLQFIIC